MQSKVGKHLHHQQYIEEGFRQGNHQRLEELYELYQPKLLNWLRKNSGEAEDAKDLFQEGLLVLIAKSNDPSFMLTCPIGAFLYAIWRNKWLATLKVRKPRVEIFEIEEYYSEKPADELVDQYLLDLACFKLLNRTYHELSDRCQQLMQLLKEGKSNQEILELLKVEKVNALYKRRHDCISRWNKLLKQDAIFKDCKANYI